MSTSHAPLRLKRSARGRSAGLLGCLALTTMLAGCGMSVNKAADVGLTTSSVPATPAPDTQMASDQSIIRNAVSATDLQSVGQGGVSWANTDTGSRGAISSISEYAESNSGLTCRKFVVSRESYSGVSLYDGDACLVNGGAWQLRAFKSM
ncbi:RT0821/Lpp0805 family surface protein [Tianweitania populi]|uniref:RT0821/Lpp0805 family surface protein n=1 Tax=Tianweitania populi TaxID=1607949 RepID=UPI00167C3A13|nr:RT0821/Lpp0805 family surface protein [Tianweitania populi]